MTFDEAVSLIENEALLRQDGPAVWADLGSGSGLFTRALAHFLQPGSTIYAVDKDRFTPPVMENAAVQVIGHHVDFEKEVLHVPSLDGILMANALHYVRDPVAFLIQCRENYNNSVFVFVEYDTSVAVRRWVPYPVPFTALKSHCVVAGYPYVEKMGTRPSSFGHAELYAAFAHR